MIQLSNELSTTSKMHMIGGRLLIESACTLQNILLCRKSESCDQETSQKCPARHLNQLHICLLHILFNTRNTVHLTDFSAHKSYASCPVRQKERGRQMTTSGACTASASAGLSPAPPFITSYSGRLMDWF